MKKIILIIILSVFTGAVSCVAQIDTSALKYLNNKLKEYSDKQKQIIGYKKDIERYNKLLKNKSITDKEFNDLIKGIYDLLEMTEPPKGEIKIHGGFLQPNYYLTN